MGFFEVFEQVAVLFIIIVIGVIVAKRKLVGEGFRKELSTFVMNVTLPCTIFHSMLMEFSWDSASQVFPLLGINVVALFAGVGVGKLLTRLLGVKERKQQAVYEFSMGYSNFGFMGWPVCLALFGQEGLFFSAIYGVPYHALLYVVGSWLFEERTEKGGFNWKSQLSPINISVVIGLIVYFGSVPVAPVIEQVTDIVGAATVPLSMCVAGMLLGSSKFSECFRNWKAFAFTLMRLLVMPVLTFAVLKLFGASGYVLKIPVIISGMPAAANVTLMAEIYDGDSYLSAQVVFISTLFSLITIPFIVLLVV